MARFSFYLAFQFALAVLFLGPAACMELITADEARLPPAELFDVRGPVPGPEIEIQSPESEFSKVGVPPREVSKTLKSPFRLVLRFKPHGGSVVNLESLSVKYVKDPFVDLTDRVRPFIAGQELTIQDANAPLGTHLIRIQIKDSAGRLGTEFLELHVAQ